jgi:hypothetical protein
MAILAKAAYTFGYAKRRSKADQTAQATDNAYYFAAGAAGIIPADHALV